MANKDDFDPQFTTRVKKEYLAIRKSEKVHLRQVARTATQLFETERSDKPVACEKGCSWCCYQPVAVSLFDLSLVVAALRRQRTPAELETLSRQCTEWAKYRRSLAADEQWLMRCPLLTEEETCSVYDARPAACRSYSSFEVHACERAHGMGTALPPSKQDGKLQRAQMLVTWILIQALHAKNRHPKHMFELAAALAVGLRLPEDRWTAVEARSNWHYALFPNALPALTHASRDREATSRERHPQAIEPT